MCDINSRIGATHYHAKLGLNSQRSCSQRVCFLLCNMARIYDLWDGSLDKPKVHGLVLCCGQDGYPPKVPQQHIVIYIQINITHINMSL